MARSISRLTNYDVKNFKHNGNGQSQQFLWEQGTGLGVGITRNGTKSFFVSGQIVGKNKTRRKSIGRVDDFNDIRAARVKAAPIYAAMQDGIDPFETDIEKKGISVSNAIDDYVRDLRSLGRRPASIQDYEYFLKRWLSSLNKTFNGKQPLILDDWMDRAVFDLKKSEIQDRHRAIGVHHSSTANQVFRCLRAVINLQISRWDDEALGPPPTNVVSIALRKRWYPENVRKRVLGDDEIRVLLKTLDEWEGNKLVPPFLRIMLFAGLRVGEVASLKRKYVKSDRINIPGKLTKNGQNFEVPLVGQLADDIKDIEDRIHPLMAHEEKCLKWLFPSTTSESGRMTCKQWPQQAVCEVLPQDWPRWTSHDLRRTFSSIAARLGASPYQINLLTNHRISGVNRSYVHLDFNDHAEWLNKINEYLQNL